jgi:methyl-accepting chemotaxis protein
MQIELRRVPNAEQLLNDARDAAESAEHLAASVDQGVDLGHAAKDFQEFDKAWHHLSAQLNRTAGTSRSLRRGVVRVVQVDVSLHRLLGVPAPVDVQEVRRLAELLAQSAQHLLEDVQTQLGRIARYAQTLQAADDFAETAEHFRDSVAQGVNVEHARKDFAAVDDAWQQLSDGLYAPGMDRLEHLQEAASRVAPIVGQLAAALGIVPEPVRAASTTHDAADPTGR